MLLQKPLGHIDGISIVPTVTLARALPQVRHIEASGRRFEYLLVVEQGNQSVDIVFQPLVLSLDRINFLIFAHERPHLVLLVFN